MASSMTEADADAGMGTTDHFVPSQCSTRPLSGAPLPSCCPAAQALSGLMASTAYRWLPVEPGSGVGTTDQVLPFQCSASVSKMPLAPSWSPTTHTSSGDGAEAANSMSRREPGCGLFAIVHDFP